MRKLSAYLVDSVHKGRKMRNRNLTCKKNEVAKLLYNYFNKEILFLRKNCIFIISINKLSNN